MASPIVQGKKKVPSSCPGKVDCPTSEQVTFQCQASSVPTKSLQEQAKTAPVKKNFRATCPRSKLEFKFFGVLLWPPLYNGDPAFFGPGKLSSYTFTLILTSLHWLPFPQQQQLLKPIQTNLRGGEW